MEDAIVGLAVIIPIIVLAGGILIVLMGMYQHTKTLDMRHRERMAMIERGLSPLPEGDAHVHVDAARRVQRRPAPPRNISLGIAMVGLGLGLMMIIGFAGGAPDVGVGVGGAVAILGIAFIVNGYVQRQYAPGAPAGAPSTPEGTPGRHSE